MARSPQKKSDKTNRVLKKLADTPAGFWLELQTTGYARLKPERVRNGFKVFLRECRSCGCVFRSPHYTRCRQTCPACKKRNWQRELVRRQENKTFKFAQD